MQAKWIKLNLDTMRQILSFYETKLLFTSNINIIILCVLSIKYDVTLWHTSAASKVVLSTAM